MSNDTDIVDLYIFEVPSPEITQSCVRDFCNISTESYIHGTLNSIVSDNDYSYIEGFYGRGLHDYVKELTTNAIHTVFEAEDSYDPEIVDMIHNHQAYVYQYLYVSFISMFSNFLIHVPMLFEQIGRTGNTYRDYGLSSTGVSYILRLVRGIQYGR